MKNISIREDLLITELKRLLEMKYKLIDLGKYHNIDFTKYHHHARNGFYSTLSKIVLDAYSTPRKDKDGHIRGFHIHSKLIHLFERNNLVKDIGVENILHKAHDSTYHANNARGKSNGYTNWYIFDEWVKTAKDVANYRFKKMIQHNEKYENTSDKYKNIVKEIITSSVLIKNTTNTDYIKIHKQYFIHEYKLFIDGLSEQFSILLNRVFYWDEHYVYVDNSPYTKSLEGNGRSYTLVGLLSKSLRGRLLMNHVEYDIDTTAQTIFLNLYYMDTIKGHNNFNLKQLKKDFPEHYKLLTEKQSFRSYIGGFFKVDSATAKKIITHITYSPDASVIRTYMKDKTPGIKAKAKIGIKAFVQESKIIRKEVLEKFYYQKEDHNPHFKIGNLKLKAFKPLIDEEIRVNNLKLKGKGRGKKRDDRIAFRITELIEHQIRECMIQLFHKLKAVENVYQIHDAVIIDKSLKGFSAKVIEVYVKKYLDFNISVSQKVL